MISIKPRNTPPLTDCPWQDILVQLSYALHSITSQSTIYLPSMENIRRTHETGFGRPDLARVNWFVLPNTLFDFSFRRESRFHNSFRWIWIPCWGRGYRSSSLSGSSGERWYGRDGRDGRDDGFGSLGLALRKFLAFVLELKR